MNRIRMYEETRGKLHLKRDGAIEWLKQNWLEYYIILGATFGLGMGIGFIVYLVAL